MHHPKSPPAAHSFLLPSKYDVTDDCLPELIFWTCNQKWLRIVLSDLGAVSSVVEHYLDTVGVTGSKPVSRTILVVDNKGVRQSFKKVDATNRKALVLMHIKTQRYY